MLGVDVILVNELDAAISPAVEVKLDEIVSVGKGVILIDTTISLDGEVKLEIVIFGGVILIELDKTISL